LGKEVERDIKALELNFFSMRNSSTMKAKRQRLPIIEAFLLTGLLLDFLSHTSLNLDRSPPQLAQVTPRQNQ
jgi:hypothetical protein